MGSQAVSSWPTSWALRSSSALRWTVLWVTASAVLAGELQSAPGHEPVAVGVADEVVVDPTGVFGQVGGVQAGCLGHQGHLALGDELVERFLAAEVGVDAFLAGLRGFGDALDARSGDPVLGELGRGRGDDAVASGVCAGRGRHALRLPDRTVWFGVRRSKAYGRTEPFGLT